MSTHDLHTQGKNVWGSLREVPSASCLLRLVCLRLAGSLLPSPPSLSYMNHFLKRRQQIRSHATGNVYMQQRGTGAEPASRRRLLFVTTAATMGRVPFPRYGAKRCTHVITALADTSTRNNSTAAAMPPWR